MSAAPENLLLRAKLRDGRVADVEIVSPRADPSPLFIGLSPAEAATVAGRLFALCPSAQSLAALAAGEAALGVESDEETRRKRALALLCERLGEMLRASLLDWPADHAPAPEDVMRLRDALKLLRAAAQENAGPDLMEPLREAARGLGLHDAKGGAGFFARQLAEGRAEEAGWEAPAARPDFLGAADDRAVCEAMMADKGFSRAPALPGRCAETGAAARAQCAEDGLAARLAARLADMAATLDAIGQSLRGGEGPEALLSASSEKPGQGFAAVDSARGRLYHALRLDGAGRIADYRIVAPTEWNFHPAGPFARALRGARIGAGASARRRIERLAFVFDPCIRASAELLDESQGDAHHEGDAHHA
jgi:hypothetical protein